MAKKLSCWIGRHTWVTRVEQGESYKVCSACGKPPRGGKGDITGTSVHAQKAMYGYDKGPEHPGGGGTG